MTLHLAEDLRLEWIGGCGVLFLRVVVQAFSMRFGGFQQSTLSTRKGVRTFVKDIFAS